MRNVAMELNLSEMAFLHPESYGYRLRWFTPAVEVKLCGHATLASAHILWETGELSPQAAARFQTLSGLLTATRNDSGDISMDFPATPVENSEPPPGLLEALGVERANFVGRSKFDYLIEVESAATVRALKPNLSRLAEVKARGVIVTSRADVAEFDFISRFFAPASGVPEDPVTGSAHCALGPHWAGRLGRNELRAYQASARGGRVSVKVVGDRVLLGGRAVTVMRCELL